MDKAKEEFKEVSAPFSNPMSYLQMILSSPEIEYCKGINYIASFLIMVFKNTEVAFNTEQKAIKLDHP